MFAPSATTVSVSSICPRRPSRGRPQSLSSLSWSSALSSQHQFTQSDTEVEEEIRFWKRRRVQQESQPRGGRQQKHGQPLTPPAGIGRRRKAFFWVSPPPDCSTPKSSRERLLDETSIYFRPSKHPTAAVLASAPLHYSHHNQQQQAMGRRRQQQKLISDFYRQSRRRNGERAKNEGGGMVQMSRTPNLVRRHNRQRQHRRPSSNPLLTALLRDEQDELDRIDGGGEGRGGQRCSSPILLDFRRQRTPSSENCGKENCPPSAAKPVARPLPPAIGPNPRHPQQRGCALSSSSPSYSNLPLLAAGGQRLSSDSGMEGEAAAGGTTEEDCWERQTQFVNLSAQLLQQETLYENLPPPPLPPQRLLSSSPAGGPPPPPMLPPMMAFLPAAEDFAALYARLVALAFADVWRLRRLQQKESGGGGNSVARADRGSPTFPCCRRLRVAQRQLAELVGVRLLSGAGCELGLLESEASFRRKCGEFCSQLAHRMRQTEALSRKEFNWQAKKLQKLLNELRMEEQEQSAPLVASERMSSTLQKIFRRIFSRK